MTVGDGIATIGYALAGVGIAWAVACRTLAHASIRAETLRRLGEPTWQAKGATARRPA